MAMVSIPLVFRETGGGKRRRFQLASASRRSDVEQPFPGEGGEGQWDNCQPDHRDTCLYGSGFLKLCPVMSYGTSGGIETKLRRSRPPPRAASCPASLTHCHDCPCGCGRAKRQ